MLHLRTSIAELIGKSRPIALTKLAVGALAMAFVSVHWPGDASARGPQSLADVAEPLLGAVVNISTSQSLKGPRGIPLPKVPDGSPFEDFFKDFFNSPDKPRRRRVSSLGSGFVIDPAGLIVTNNHVIKGADEIFINFSDGSKLKVVKIVGRDEQSDLALLKVNPKSPLPFVKFGRSKALRVGDWVMAIGNPFGLGGSVSIGIVSAKNRDINVGHYDEFIQTDAAINKGNSGGPLFNMDGEVIGVNTAIFSPTGGSIGIGFALPSDAAALIIDQLRRFGKTERGWLGVQIQAVTEAIAQSLGMGKPRGAMVSRVTPNSPAAKGGLKAGDVILKFNGENVPRARALARMVARGKVGMTVDIEVLRDKQRRIFKVLLGKQKVAKVKTPAGDKPGDVEASLLGLELGALNKSTRKEFDIDPKIKSGVVVLEVNPNSEAAKQRIEPGDVILEATQVRVSSVKALKARINELSKAGKTQVLLLVARGENDLKFIALPLAGKPKDGDAGGLAPGKGRAKPKTHPDKVVPAE